MTLKNTGERLVPDYVDDNDPVAMRLLPHHLARYRWIAPHVLGKRVLDVACGSGFGSRLLLDAGAKEVVGVDISPEAVEYARHRYGCSGLSFHVADAEELEVGTFDIAVSCETIEHVPSPPRFLAALVRSVVPGGLLALSATMVPTRDIYPYHRHDFTRDSLARQLAPYGLIRVDDLCQSVKIGRNEILRSQRLRGMQGLGKLLWIAIKRPVQFGRRVREIILNDGLIVDNCTWLLRCAQPATAPN